MRIESVTAHGFGPLAGQTLGLAPGFTVVVGDNESGKSSWHAATFAALCGRRRARGRPGVQEQRFIDAHQPWSGEPWAVSCRLRLDDGRRIELRQDLSGKVDCRATDTALARDVSSEIMVDGSPDASAWLGLTRTTFRATACAGQADVLGVLEAAEGLQHSLQRAASTAGASGTAAAAILRLEACRRESVGRDTASAVKPLRRALDAVSAAQAQLATARECRAEFSELAEQQAELDADLAGAHTRAEEAAALADAAAAALHAAELQAVRDHPRLPSGQGQRPRPRWGQRPGPRMGQRLRSAAALVAAGLAFVAVALLVAAIVGGSPALGVLGGVAAVLSGWSVTRAVRGTAAAQAPLPHAETPQPPEPREVAGLRLELRERQALAESARRRHHDAAVRAGQASAVLSERARVLPETAAAEEALASAERELAKVRELDRSLGHAIAFLQRAEEQVHREIVPELTGLLRAWLPQLTGGRYDDVRMDPATLAVEVCGPTREFRRAELLSHGTAEQIYLLLRVALAARLTAGHDTCPLLLDDVTVHADPQRAGRLLELLHRLSGERQIVLFAHQEQVRDWAFARFDGERDALIELEPVGARLAPV